MEIRITCRACGRGPYPLALVVDPESRPGHCPFCGEVLAFQYAGTFVDTARRVLAVGPELVRHLTSLAELAGGFAIDPESVLGPVQEALAIQDARLAEPYRPGWPPREDEPVG